jgi:hypothetical protein
MIRLPILANMSNGVVVQSFSQLLLDRRRVSMKIEDDRAMEGTTR